MHPPRDGALKVGPMSFNVNIAWYQVPNIGIYKFFDRGHRKIFMAKKHIWDFFQLWARNSYTSPLGVSKT